MRRVVVTGLGAITPLGVGIQRTWTRLLAGHSGIVSLKDVQPAERWRELTSTVAGIVPEAKGGDDGSWDASQWLEATEQRRMSRFTQYAVAASKMALKDAGLEAMDGEDRENTGVCLGSGIGNLEEMYDTSIAHSLGVRCLPFILTRRHVGSSSSSTRGIKRYHHSSCQNSSSTWQPATSP